MWSWTSFLIGAPIWGSIGALAMALFATIPKCHCCPNEATTTKIIDGIKIQLCQECKELHDNIRIEVTE